MIKKNPTKKAELKASKIVNAPVQFLAEGENAEIYKTKIDGIIYLVKIFNKKINTDQMNYLLLLSDQKLIPAIHEIDHKYLIMDYINVPDLEDILNTKISKREIQNILKLVYIELLRWHGLGYVHGDLNPSNILLLKNKVIFIDPDLQRFLDPEHYMQYDILALEELENDFLKK